jgi:hypothetical protein
MTHWSDRYTSPRPVEEQLHTERVPVDGAQCPACGSSDVRRYPVASHMGPRMATKCQDCFTVLALDRPTADDPWPPFRAVTYGWTASLAERAARDALIADLAKPSRQP